MRRNDGILIVALLAIGVTLLLLYQFVGKQQGSLVIISVDGVEYKRLPLSQDIELEIKSENGGTNVLQIKDGYAKITSASCPDLLCVHQNKIRYQGETLICLPNKMTVRVIGGKTNDVDAVTN